METEQVLLIAENVEAVKLLEITPFEWDVIYSFSPYTSKEEIYKVVGYKWDHISGTVSEGMNQIVFMNDSKVVCYLYGYPTNNGYGLWLKSENYIEEASTIKLEVRREEGVVYLDQIR